MLATGRPGIRSPGTFGGTRVQTTQPRDLGALLLVIAVFVVLFVVTLMLGAPAR
jgi:hypothetical protein